MGQTSAAEYKTYDEMIRAQAEIVSTILTTGIENQEAADKAFKALDRLRSEVTQNVSALATNVTLQIGSSAETTAKKAAELLHEKFIEADAAAEAAAKRYRTAGRWLSLKLFMGLIIFLMALGLAAWLLVLPLLPSFEELQMRRDEISTLNARVADLEKKGIHLEWSTCLDKSNRPLLCFRTTGQQYGDSKNGESYAIPYRSKR